MDEIDAGVRRLVAWLNEHGFETSDSGDGRSKFERGLAESDGVLRFPHVVITTTAADALRVATRLAQELRAAGVQIEMIGCSMPSIQITIDVCDLSHATVMLMDLDDEEFEEGLAAVGRTA